MRCNMLKSEDEALQVNTRSIQIYIINAQSDRMSSVISVVQSIIF